MPAGRAPERSTIERSSASRWVKFPSIMPLSLICDLTFGAVITRPSRTMASPLPTFSPVSLPNALAPSGVRLNSTIGSRNWPKPGRAVFRSRPVTVRAFCTA